MISTLVLTSLVCAALPPFLALVAQGSDPAAVCRRCIRMWEEGDLAPFDELIARDYAGHVASGTRDRDGLRERIREFHALFPDVDIAVEDQFVQGERVVTRMRASGTNSRTGARAELIGINISRVVNGKLLEEWATWEPAAPRPGP
jgi:hypothetical protein